MADETITPKSESMVERVARAMHDLDRRPHRTWTQASEETKLLYLDRAQAAIAALREPTEAMLIAARNTYYDPESQQFSEAQRGNPDRHVLAMAANDWRAMIDAALEE